MKRNTALAGSNILLIRHAEKGRGRGLSPLGRARAQGWAAFLPNLPLSQGRSANPVSYSFLFASKPTDHSDREHHTLQPLAERLGLDTNTSYANEHYARLAHRLLHSAKFQGTNIVICWHHSHILRLAEKLPGDPLPPRWPQTEWPDHVFGWLLWISYSADGTLGTRTGCYR